MKINIFACILFSFLINPAFAAETVKVETLPIQIQSEMIKNKFHGFDIFISNSGKNPVNISSIDVKNVVNNANTVLVSDTMLQLRKLNKLAYAGVVTLGVTSLIYSSKSSKLIASEKAALSEAATFKTQSNLENMKSEIIMPNKTKSFKILIPLNEKPVVECLLQDTTTNNYINVELKN